MITDRETNFVYISDRLESQCPNVFRQLKHNFEKLDIKHEVLSNTKDLWVVDFMPLQINRNDFLQFVYDPDYLKPKKYQHTRTNQKDACDPAGIIVNKSSIILDGGNVVKHGDKAILTSKIFKENPDYSEDDLIDEIKAQLQIEQLIIIPQEPRDFVGHADGMVRFIDEDSVLVNQYPKNKAYEDFAYSLRASLRKAGLHCIEFPYTSWQNGDANDATGCYINFLETGKYIFYPVFTDYNDQLALRKLQSVFKDREFTEIDCRELAKFGGVLNCATWNILT